MPGTPGIIQTQVIAGFVPITQDPAGAPVTVDLNVMVVWPVCMAVNQQLRITMQGDHGMNRMLVHIHDRFRLGAFLRFTAHAQGFDLRSTRLQWLGKKCLLPGRLPHLPTKRLIGHVVGTKRIAVGQQRMSPTHLDLDRILQQRRPRSAGKALRHQEIAVAVHDEDRRSMFCQIPEGADNGLRMGVLRQRIVTCPIFEQIAQHIQRRAPLRCCTKKIQQELRRVRTVRAKMQVRDQENGVQLASARSMMTSSTGTS